MHAKGVKTYAGIRSTCWCVWFQVYKAIKGPVLLTIAGWAGPCWIDLCVCVCVSDIQARSSKYCISWVWCPFYDFLGSLRTALFILYNTDVWSARYDKYSVGTMDDGRFLDLNVWLMSKVVKQDDGFNSSRVGWDVTGASGLSAALQGTGIAMLPGWLDEHYPVSKSIQYYPVPQVRCTTKRLFSTHKFCCLEWSTSKIRIPSSHLCRRNSRDSLLGIQDPVLLISTARQLWWRNPATLSMISFSTVVWLLEV